MLASCAADHRSKSRKAASFVGELRKCVLLALLASYRRRAWRLSLCPGCLERAMRTNPWRWRPPAVAPPRIGGDLAAVYALLVLPALLGAALHWPEAISFALILPGILVHVRLSMRSARAQGVYVRGERPPPGSLIVLSSALGVASAVATPAPFGVLALVLVVIFVVDPLWRLAWNRAAPTTTEPVTRRRTRVGDTSSHG